MMTANFGDLKRGLAIMAWLGMSGLALGHFDDETFYEETGDESLRTLDGRASGEWWTKFKKEESFEGKENKGGKRKKRFITMHVPREEVVAFAQYTVAAGTLKLSAQLFPLMPDEAKEVRLEVKKDGAWAEIAKEEVVYPGWSAHFRVEGWDATQDVAYRVRHGEKALFEGLVRKDPVAQDEIVVASMSCNSSRTPGQRAQIIKNLRTHDPDVLFFAGDQTYHHTEHTAGWLEFGLQFREVMKDRPTITIPDDHDIGQANLWGESGKKAKTPQGPAGGYFYPAGYVNMVQRQQSWHLPDAVDPKPIAQGIGVYFTRYVVGGVDFAIVEDRKFKSGPQGKIPKMGPRPDHINDPKYDRKAVDVEGLVLLGERQLKFLRDWNEDWAGAEMKAVLSQTPFCSAVHLHGRPDNRLLADLDSNAWPQTGRKKALTEIRKSWACHIAGDQHLATSVQHGIEAWGDGPFGFASPALVNTVYGRWWHPLEEKAGPNAVEGSALDWTGDFEDGLGNKIRMLAYANPQNRQDEKQRADGYGIVRFKKSTKQTVFECWPRFCDVTAEGAAQFAGWPIEFTMRENDGRTVVGSLPALKEAGVVQVVAKASGEVLYTVRVAAGFEPPVYAKGSYLVKVGKDSPEKELGVFEVK